MFENVYAHTKKNDASKEHWQTLKDHLEGVAELAEKFAQKFGSGAWGRAAGILHDVGKAHESFQEYLEKVNANPDEKLRCAINHSTDGAIYAERNLGSFIGRTLAYVVAGHHAGLPDAEGSNQASLRTRTQGNYDDKLFAGVFESLGVQIQQDSLPSPETFKLNSDNYNFWVRFLFSCLVDADRLNTEKFDDKKKNEQRGHFKKIPELKNDFDVYMELFNQTPPADDPDVRRLRIARNDVLNACRESGRSEIGGLHTLSVPTGGGKTLSSMAFALEKAVKLNKDRIIYVVPFTTIIEQTGEKFAEIFGKENVVEHHSNFDASKKFNQGEEFDKEEYDEYLQKIELATENWDAPIIVTTNVQFFESLFAAKTSRCRKLHNIVNSVVILDEAQALPTNFIAPCVEALNVLSESFGVVPILCTATQPAFEYIDKIDSVGEKYKPLNPANPIISPELESRLFADLARVRYEFKLDQRRSWEELAKELASPENEEVLCIVNTRKDCYELYQELKKQVEGQESARTIGLSALMCSEHRSKIIREIREILERNRTQEKKIPLRVVATQLVEAGVDIDFPVVYRALAGLDSIVQAGGRCNREGKLGCEGGKVVVFSPEKDECKNLPPSIKNGVSATKTLVDYKHFTGDKPEIFKEYFKQFYAFFHELDQKIVSKEKYSDNTPYICEVIKEKNVDFFLSDDLSPKLKEIRLKNKNINIPFRKIGDSFKLIDDGYTVPVVVNYGHGKCLVEYLQSPTLSSDFPTSRELQRYIVNIPKSSVQKLTSQNKIIQVPSYKGILEDFYIQTSSYDKEIGFDVFDENDEFLAY